MPVFQRNIYVIALDKTSTTDIILLLSLFLKLIKAKTARLNSLIWQKSRPLLYKVSHGVAQEIFAFAHQIWVHFGIFKPDNLYAPQGEVKRYLA